MAARRTHKPIKKGSMDSTMDYMTIGGLKIPKVHEVGAMGSAASAAAKKPKRKKKKKKKKK